MNLARFRFALSSALALSSLTGCGSNEVSGAIGGKDFDLKSVISGAYTVGDNGTNYVVIMSNEEDLCAKLEAGGLQNPPNFQMLFFGLAEANFSTGEFTKPKGPGTFEVFSAESTSLPKTNQVASVFYMESDANGASKYPDLVVGTKGSIVLDDIGTNDALAGEGELTLSTGDTLEIEYDATACSAISNMQVGNSGPDPNPDPEPPPPDPEPLPGSAKGAWTFTFGSEPGCYTPNATDSFGVVSNMSVMATIPNSPGMANVDCRVDSSQMYLYGNGTLQNPDISTIKSLQFEVSWIAGATKDNPAKGTIYYETTTNTWGSDSCNYYLVDGTPQSVDKYKFWVAYNCPSLTGGNGQCSAAEGYVYFENCRTQ